MATLPLHPATASARRLKTSATSTSLPRPAAETITMVEPNGGAVHTFSATDAAAQAQLPRIKPGYKLTIIDLQAVIVAIERKHSGDGEELVAIS